jgi:hypothetical protein
LVDEEGEKKELPFFSCKNSLLSSWLRARILGINRAGASDLERNQAREHEQQGLVGLANALRDQRESSEKLDKKISFSPSSPVILSPGSSEASFLYIPSPLSRRQRSIRLGEHKHKSKEAKKSIKKQQEREKGRASAQGQQGRAPRWALPILICVGLMVA